MAILCSYFIVLSIANLLKSKYLVFFFKHHPHPIIILSFVPQSAHFLQDGKITLNGALTHRQSLRHLFAGNCQRFFDESEYFLLTLSEFRLRHVSVMVSDIQAVFPALPCLAFPLQPEWWCCIVYRVHPNWYSSYSSDHHSYTTPDTVPHRHHLGSLSKSGIGQRCCPNFHIVGHLHSRYLQMLLYQMLAY